MVETQFGVGWLIPYRWRWKTMSAPTRPWLNGSGQQNAVTQAHSALSQRGWFAQRIRALMDYERFGLPHKAGCSISTPAIGPQNQSQLFVRVGWRA